MAIQSDYTVYDGAATPVQHSMTAAGNIVDGVSGAQTATWTETIAGLPSEAQIRCTMIKKRLKSGVIQTTTRYEVPVMESVSGQNTAGYTAAPKVAYVDRMEWTTFAHPRSVENTRTICWQLLLNTMNGSTSSNAPTKTSPAALLHQKQIAVS